jgi:tight adherence protein B
MSLRLLPSLAAMLAAAVTATPAAAASPLSVAFGNSGRFPSRSLIASAPASHPLRGTTVHVTENGVAVKEVSVTPAGVANAGDFGVILLIDASQSMRGQPIRQAMLAARTLAAERTGNQELGLIAFNRSSTTVLPLTSNPISIRSALGHLPRLASGTQIYDATLLAIRQLHDSGVAAGTVIVLSDGADVRSQSSPAEVAAAAANDHVRVYTVGITDRFFSGRTLVRLARSTGGSYTASNAERVRNVFTRVESQLTNRYVVRYRSAVGLGKQIQVRVSANGIPGAWVGSYASPPPLTPVRAGSDRQRTGHPSFWASSLALVLVAFTSAAVLVGGLFVHLIARTRRHDLRRRIGRFTIPERAADPVRPASTQASLAAHAQTWLEHFQWWPRFREEVDVAAIDRTPADLVMLTVLAALTAAVLLSLLLSAPVIALPVVLTGPMLLWAIVHTRAERQRRLFVDQLPGQLEQVGSAMRAGHSVVAALAALANDAPDPTRRELTRVVTDEQLGVPLDAALRPVARRMACSDIEQLALVATLNQRTGGNMAEVLDLIADGARERADLRRELRALTAQARMSRWIVTALPPAVLGALAVVRPSYLHPLLHTTPGVFALCLATGFVVLGSFVMRILVPPEG